MTLCPARGHAELTTYNYYTIQRVNLIGLEGEGLKEITEGARIEDRNHFEALVPRIYELGGKPPRSDLCSKTHASIHSCGDTREQRGCRQQDAEIEP